MRRTPLGTGFSATDLAAFLECTHRTVLDLSALSGELERPAQNDIERRLLEIRGVEHEARVLQHYRESGKRVITISAQPGAQGSARAAEQTLEAMQSGAEVIYQAALSHGVWSGRPDFLLKVDGGGGHWPHHYEVVDAKLAREAKARAVLQLCVYTDHLDRIQGRRARHFHIAVGGGEGGPRPPVSLLADDFMAYYRALRGRFEAFVEREQLTYPEPVEHCGVCVWWKRCEERRRSDDHLSLVAGISRRQRDRLVASGVQSVAALGKLAPAATIDGIALETLTRVREQARLQLSGRAAGKVMYELLSQGEAGTGLEALPEPSAGDLFLDLEGDAFFGGQGLEYLFGLVDLGEPVIDKFSFDFTERSPGPPRYHGFWSSDPGAEKRAFEAVIDRIVRGREEFPNLHVYHFGHRENDALKKLSCRHKTRETELDDLLRAHVLVDLHPIVRHALRASVEGYTLKQLEPLHGFSRSAELRAAAQAMQLFGYWLETQAPDLDPGALRKTIEAYNRDDCLSTLSLRNWLEARRPELEKAAGRKLGRPRHEPSAEGEQRSETRQAAAAVGRRLLAGLPDDPANDDDAQRSRRLLADLLEWHWREAKSSFWEHFRARELPPDDRIADAAVLGGLVYEGVVDKIKRSDVHRYTFPEQEHAVRVVPQPIDPATGKSAGEVVSIGSRHIDLKRGSASSVPHPSALVPGKPIDTAAQQQSLLAIGEALADDANGESFRLARQLLSRAPLAERGASLLLPGESVQAALARLASGLDGSALAVQGPPGSGKTHQAALMILALVRAGKRVGVTANSHAVIKNVLKKVFELAGDSAPRTLHLQDDDDDTEIEPFAIHGDKARAARELAKGALDLVGGTAWTWVAERFAQTLDVLVVDEAGQMSLANVLAISRAATSMVLFGDPAQLEQPQKGVHPPGADLSALEHLLGDALTLPPERGVFLPYTRRLHPRICDFVSEVFYESRLRPEAALGLEHQALEGPAPFAGSGLRYMSVSHQGNSNFSSEEVERVQALIGELLDGRISWIDRKQRRRPLGAEDVLVVAPYNAHVAALKRALPREVRVGTVDKFQGQEAAVVIYSLATSTPEDAPRGLEFLYSLNRLNVAISRAQALAILVASPELTRAVCKTPRQLKLVNALCAYLERCP